MEKMKLINVDELLKKMNLSIAIIKMKMKNFGLEEDEACKMELKAYEDIRNGIKEEPIIEPDRKNGKWIKDGHHIQCNQCGISICDRDREGDVLPKKFCPNCGSYNGGEENDI